MTDVRSGTASQTAVTYDEVLADLERFIRATGAADDGQATLLDAVAKLRKSKYARLLYRLPT